MLAVLLAVSVTALAAVMIHGYMRSSEPASVTVPENIITTDKAGSADEAGGALPDGSGGAQDAVQAAAPAENTAAPAEVSSASVTASVSGGKAEKAKVLYLHNKQASDNVPFNAANMFPGDAETGYYCVKVTYKNTVTVRYHADIHDGYDKLAEVLKVKINLLTTGETLYDGLMKDMPESIDHKLSSDSKTTDELYYEVTAYLDTSVGNEYMEKELLADFRWWVEDTVNLEPAAATGDTSMMVLWACMAAGSVVAIVILCKRQKKEAVQSAR